MNAYISPAPLFADYRDEIKVAEKLVTFEENGESLAAEMAAVLTCNPSDFPTLAQRFFLTLGRKVQGALEEDEASKKFDDEGDAYARWLDRQA